MAPARRAAARMADRISGVAGRIPECRAPDVIERSVNVDLTATVSQLETNVPLDEAAFTVDAPPGASELSVAELREAGPLRN